MKKENIIKKNKDFSVILNNGTKTKNEYYTVFYKPSTKTHYGISIPTKTCNAVTRNKIKRQIKNIIDNNKNSIQTNYDYVIIIKKSILDIDYQEKEQKLIELMSKIGDKNEKEQKNTINSPNTISDNRMYKTIKK